MYIVFPVVFGIILCETPLTSDDSIIYRSILGKRPLQGKHPCISFQEVYVAASLQTYESCIPGKHPCGPKSLGMFKRPWALTRDTTVYNML